MRNLRLGRLRSRPMIDEKLAALKDAGFTDDYEGFVTGKIEEGTSKAVPDEECSLWVKENVKSPSAQ